MRTIYAVNWRGPSNDTCSGELEIGERSLVLEGRNGHGSARSEIMYGDVAGVHVAHEGSDRLGGRPTLIIDRRSAPPIRIASVAQAGIVSELAEHLGKVLLRQQRATSRLVVVVPIREGALDQVRAFLDQGPPFDLEEAGLERHQVFLTAAEAIFVFEAADRGTLDELASRSSLWIAAAKWRDLVAGPVRIGGDAYTWGRPQTRAGLSYEVTPGPGDSEGGDVFAP